jgi:hypothetical protein
VLAFINDEIEDLELDVAGKPRYTYTVRKTVDNGDTDYLTEHTFKTAEQAHNFIKQAVLEWQEYTSEDDVPPVLPTSESIDKLMEKAKSQDYVPLYSYGEEGILEISFTIKRDRLN